MYVRRREQVQVHHHMSITFYSHEAVDSDDGRVLNGYDSDEDSWTTSTTSAEDVVVEVLVRLQGK